MMKFFGNLVLSLALAGAPLVALSFQTTENQLKTELENARTAGDQRQIADVQNRLGTYYLTNGRANDAITAYKESVEINQQIGNTRAVAVLSSSIGMAYSDLNQYSQAVQYLNQSIQAFQSMGNKRSLAGEYMNLANVRKYSGQYAESNSAVEEGLRLAKELQDKNLLKNFYLLQSENYRALGNGEKANEAFQNYSIWKNQLDQERIAQTQAQAQQTQQALSQREQQLEQASRVIDSTSQELSAAQQLAKLQEERISFLDEKEKLQEERSEALEKQVESEKQAQRYLIIGIGIAILLILVVLRSLMVNRRKNAILATQNNEIHQQKIELMVQRDKIRSKSKQLEEALEEVRESSAKITSSINYAKRIQEAMLPTIPSIKASLPDSFVLFKPRDIVSGDFYWFNKLENVGGIGDTRTIITAVDCTGHGVPGAFMSMIGSELLNKIVLMQRYAEPGKIVTELHDQIRMVLKQEDTANRDGMDLAMCTIHGDGKTVEYSGAQNPLIYIQEGEVFQVKATRFSVGGIQKEDDRQYENHVIPVDKPTWFYLFSDGYADQFGGQAGRKFMIKRLKELLLDIHQMPAEEQRQRLDEAIEKWKDGFRQIDDILVIGFKVG